MRIMLKSIATIIASVLLSVAAIASPINVTAYAVTVPQTITLGQDDNSEVTHNDFVAVQPYVVDLAVATHVPIELTTAVTQVELRSNVNAAVKQNTNFERWLN